MDNSILWRYMDFTRFVAMLSEGGIYFPNAASLEDPFEGSVPLPSIRAREAKWRAAFYSHQERKAIYERIFKAPGVVCDNPEGIAEAQALGDGEDIEALRAKHGSEGRALEAWLALKSSSASSYIQKEFTFISCWHQSPTESAALWRLYSQSNDCVCITTRPNRLRTFLNAALGEGRARFDAVEYIDYETATFPWLDDSHFDPTRAFLYKRKSFEHEKEVRAIFTSWEHLKNRGSKTFSISEPLERHGKYARGDLSQVIEMIYASPYAPEWFRALVTTVGQRYGLSAAVLPSGLAQQPRF